METTGARGLIAKAGRYGCTFAHRDIAFEFGSWLSPEFKLYLIKEFQRLKEDENRRVSLAWNLNRTLANLESINAEFIHMDLPQSDRLKRLNAIAIAGKARKQLGLISLSKAFIINSHRPAHG